MTTPVSIEQNLRFLIIEVQRQLDRTRKFLAQPSHGLLEEAQARDDYIDTLKGLIQRKCFDEAARTPVQDTAAVEYLRAAEVIAVNLERIADFCEKVIRQRTYIERQDLLERRNLGPFFDEVREALSLIGEALFERDAHVAMRICRAEHNLDQLYLDAFRQILGELKRGEHAQSEVTCLFIVRYFERMGDSLLNIGEAMLSTQLGQRIKIGQLRALEDAWEAVAPTQPVTALSLHAVGETRSGCLVNSIAAPQPDASGQLVIFKEGKRKKLLEERDGIGQWEAQVPGLAPKIYSYRERGENGAILFEYLRGKTFEQILMQDDDGAADTALARLCATLADVWNRTGQPRPATAGFMHQLERRLPDIYAAHPGFRNGGGRIGTLATLNFGELAAAAAAIEQDLAAPLSVLGHGDFNVDNIIYDPEEDRVRFIDLHRSQMMDYVQDVSVFLVSNYRLQVFDRPVRRRIGRVNLAFYEFARDFAASHGDTSFPARLALGLARSFATSTRFVLDEAFAQQLVLRARYILQQVVAAGRHGLPRFAIAEDVLVD